MAKLSRGLRRRLVVSTCLMTATGVFAQFPAHAQTLLSSSTAAAAADSTGPEAQKGPTVDEVIVTADRRSTNIQRAALAITAVSGKTLDQTFTNSISGLNGVVPSLEITKASGFENQVTIRGVGSETPENGLTTVPGVSEFIDGVYIANSISLDQTLFDIKDIEVMRGPQGALYGQSSIGGAISITTTQPQLKEFSGGGDFSFGTYNLSRERAELNVPIGDDIAIRLSAQKYDHDGFTKDTAIPGFTEDDAHDASGKLALLWKPTDNFSATLTGQWYHASQHGDAQKNINDPDPNPRDIYQDYPSHFALTTQLYHLNLQWDLPWFTLKSVSAYQNLVQTQQEDGSRSAYSILGSYDDVAAWNTTVHNYTEEFDILSLPGSKLEWIGGIFLLDQTSSQFVAEFEGTGANPNLTIPANIETNPPSNLGYGNASQVTRQSYSAFAQATYHLTPSFRVTAGARINLDAYRDDSLNFFGSGVDPRVVHSEWDNVPTWRLEADYDLTSDNMIYASAARGYKPGGVNGSYGQVLIPATFKPETNTAFEVGSKNFLFDKSLRLNVEAFYYIHKDFQYIETDPVPYDGGIANIPTVDDYGVEFEAAYVGLGHRLHVNANLSLENGQVEGNYKTIDSTIQNNVISSNANCAYGGAYYNPACWAAEVGAAQNINGKTPPAMPKVSGSINASYMFDIPSGTLTPRIEYVYRGSEWARIFNDPNLDSIKAYGVTNLNIDYVPTGSRFRLSLAATNLFNIVGVNSRYTDPYGTGQTSQQYIPPQQIIASIAYSF